MKRKLVMFYYYEDSRLTYLKCSTNPPFSCHYMMTLSEAVKLVKMNNLQYQNYLSYRNFYKTALDIIRQYPIEAINLLPNIHDIAGGYPKPKLLQDMKQKNDYLQMSEG